MPAPAKQLVLALLLSTALARSDEPTQASSTDPIAAAREELKTLPNLGRTPSTGSDLNEVMIPLPAFHAPGPTSRRSLPADSRQSGEPSQGWLLDALQQSAERRFPARGDRAHTTTRWPELERSRSPEAQNPLEPYLRQWMTPQSRGILAALREPEAATGMRRQDTATPWLPRAPGMDTPSLPGLLHDRPGAPRVNPYLQPESDPILPFGPVQPRPQERDVAPALRDRTPMALPQSPAAPSTDLKGPGAAEKYPSPTAPLVDEQKYFPQLRKF